MSLIHGEDVFWVVAECNVKTLVIGTKYNSFSEASEQAQRLAQDYHRSEFFVLRSTDSWRAPKEVELIQTSFSESL